MSDKILSYHDVLLRHADAATLQDGCWINDQIIAFFFELLTHEHLSDAPSVALLPGASTYLLLNTPPHDLPAIADMLQVCYAPLTHHITIRYSWRPCGT